MPENTPCKNCCFAEYEEDTQVDCSRGMIDKYRSIGTNIIEAYDHEKEFYVIENRTCPYFRSQQWEDSLDKENFDEECERMLEFETRMAYHCITFIQDDIIPLEKSVESLAKQTLAPIQLTVVRPRKSLLKPSEVADLLKKLPFKWRLENTIDNRNHDNIVHMIQKSIKSQYYVDFDLGYEFESDCLMSINDSVIKNLLQFAMIDEKEFRVIPIGVHNYWYFRGDQSISVAENIRKYQCENNETKIIFNMNQIKNHQLQD